MEDISQKIEAIQSGSQGAVEGIGQVGTIIGQISDISTASPPRLRSSRRRPTRSAAM